MHKIRAMDCPHLNLVSRIKKKLRKRFYTVGEYGLDEKKYLSVSRERRSGLLVLRWYYIENLKTC